MGQFDLDKYLKNPNRKVVTRDGKSVRIVCTDMMGTSYPILAICRVDPTHDCYYSYTLNGKHNLGVDSRLDLFFVPEEEEGCLNLYKDENGRVQSVLFILSNLKRVQRWHLRIKTMLRPAK